MILRECNRCHMTKPITDFVKNCQSPDGYAKRCKPCHNVVARSYVKNNPERRKATLAADKEGNRKRSAKWRKNNKELANARTADWGKRNLDKRVLYASRRRSRLMNTGGDYTVEEWQSLKARFDNRCVRCLQVKKLTIDHVLPVSKGGSNSVDNFQPLCSVCNSTKATRHYDYRPIASVLVAFMNVNTLYINRTLEI